MVGAGIVGLTTAHALAEAGHSVVLQSAAFTPQTTSDVAAAIWFPYAAEPRDRVLPWSRLTFAEYESAHQRGVPGVYFREMRDLYAEQVAEPWWASAVPSWRRCGPDELPPDYRAGFVAEVPLVESTRYLDFLHDQLAELGVQQRPGFVHRLSDINGDVVVNCTGLGARLLCHDQDVTPIRGVVVRTEPAPFEFSLADDEGPNSLAYIVPRSHDCVLGGFAQYGEQTLDVRAGEVDDIIRRCARLHPAVADLAIREVLVGLRPGRASVRVEVDPNDRRVVHNYGHGGSGFTICWGCAKEVVDLVEGWAG